MSKYSLTEEDFKDDNLEKKNKNNETNALSENKQYIEFKDILETDTTKDIARKIVDDLEIKANENSNSSTKADDKIYQLLKEYRLKISKQEALKAYMVFSNEELNSLIQNKPMNKEDLLKVRGFGPKKVEKYGDCILEIINS